MARISTKNQITIPVASPRRGRAARRRADHGRAGRRRELRIPPHNRDLRGCVRDADGTYPAGYLEQLDAEDEER